MKENKIVISGYYGFGNAGDELILKSILSEWQGRYPQSEIVVLSHNPLATEDEHKIRAINRWSLWPVLKIIMDSDILLLGGGGLFQDVTGSTSLWYYLMIVWLGLLSRRKTIVHAVGIGPIRSRFNKLFIAQTLKRVNKISVRDHESLYELKKMGVTRSIELVSDPVLSLNIPFKKNKSADLKSPQIGFIIRDISRLGKDSHEQSLNQNLLLSMLSQNADDLIRKMNAKIMVLPFHPSMDQKAVDVFLSCMEMKAEVCQWQTLNDLLKLFSQMDMVVSMRLHGMILSVLMGIPAVGIAVDPKINRFVNEFCLNSSLVRVIPCESYAIAELKNEILKCWENRMQFAGAVGQKI